MSNKLDEFIANNRDAFDDKMPPGKVWDKIDASINEKQHKNPVHFPFMKWVISAAAVLIVGTMIYLQFTKKQPVEPVLVKNDTEINQLVPEYAPQVKEFAKLVGLKQEELKILSTEQPKLYKKFTKDITQLDSSYNALKSQLSVNPNKEMLIEAMIQNLQLQLNVLNQQLNIIKQIKQSKKYSHEKEYQKI